jgi:transposase
MLPEGEFHMLRDLYRQGLSISEIARQTGYNRRTVSKYVNAKVPPVSRKPSAKPSKLDSYKDYIIQRLNSGPLTACRIYREIQDRGFTGKYTIVKDFVRKVRPPSSVPAVYRFETKPGKQAQADWAECGRIEIDGNIQKLYCFNMVLGYSRMVYAEFTLSIDTPTLIQCHLNAFNFFGGYPEEILYDNMKQIVIKRAMKSSDSEWNTQFEQFFMHYGFVPRLHRPYRPQTKGKIENTVGFVKRDFFMGSSFSSFSDINNQLLSWLSRVNKRVHGTTYEIPAERFKQEKLKAFDGVPSYIVIRELIRKISRDSHVSYNGNRYSVPYIYAGREARVQIKRDRIGIFVGLEKVCEHEILTGSHRISRNKEHFRGLLSEILKENKAKSNQSSPILRFSDPVVESRPLSVYEEFSEGFSHE